MKSLSFSSIEEDFFKGKNPLKKILAIALDLLGARQTGLLYGTNGTHMRFLPSSEWDRGMMDRFDGRGLSGMILKLAGTRIITAKGLSPVFFYTTDPDGRRRDTHGIIAYVLRNSADYYRKGINVVLCPDTDRFIASAGGEEGYHRIPFYIYDGREISRPRNHIKVDTRIVSHFKSSNSVYVILPDYGIMVINTADPMLMEMEGDTFVREDDLRQRLDLLIHLVERSSLAYLGRLKGKKGAELLWRKEEHLRKAYTHLSESEKKYRDLYENGPIAYFSLTPEGRIFQCNHKAVELSGFDRADLMGKSAYDLFENQEGAEQDFKQVRETLDRGQPVRDLEVRLVRRSGERVWIILSIEAIRGRDGGVMEMRVTALNISQRKTLEKQLFQAQKMEAIGTLARGIAHDFNNLLSPVSGYAQMLLMDDGRDQEARARIQTILDCTRHAKELVNQILTFSRQREHRLVLVKARKAVEDSMVLIRSFLPSTIKIETRYGKGSGYIMADPVQLHQVIMNLVTNSYHAMGSEGGTLEVALEKTLVCPAGELGGEFGDDIPPGDYVSLSISDTGEGIDPGILSKIFEPYFTTKEEGKGSGIGLSVVHGIVKGHGGDIRVRSEPGKGTCFTLYFPVCGKQEEDNSEPPAAAGAIVTGTGAILLVDDEPIVAFTHTDLLERLGYQVTCVTRSTAALELFIEHPEAFDLVMTDFTMPDMDGLELAREICSIRPEQKVLLCTGLGDDMDRGEGHASCVAGIIGKPVEVQALSQLIQKLMAPSTVLF